MTLLAPRTGSARRIVAPYKGLASFEDSELDALLFFGRDDERDVIVTNLLGARLTVLYGPSGVGKSSILRAGVIRRVRELEPLAEVTLLDDWSGDVHLPRPVSEAFVVLDQFEEYFLYHDAAALADELADLLANADAHVNVLISIREDALAQLDAFKARIPNVLTNYLRLPRLDRAEGRAAILGPVERWNELSGEADRVEVEPALVEAVLDETAAGRVALDEGIRGGGGGELAAGGQIEAPLLQLVLERLWQAERSARSRALRLATFRQLGGAQAIVSEHLERALGALEDSEKAVAASVFNHLVTPSGARIAHRASDLAAYSQVDEADLLPVLECLTAQRILRSVDAGPAERLRRYEIFHEVLVDAVLAWRAHHVLERERRGAARRHRRLLAIAVAALLALVAVTGVAIYAFTERSEARSHARLAQARELEATALGAGPERSVGLALRAARLVPDARAEVVLRRALIESRLRGTLRGGGSVTSLAFSGGGRRLLVVGAGRLTLYDPATGRRVRVFRDPAPVTTAALGPGGLLLSGDANGDAQLRRLPSTAGPLTLPGRGAVTSVSISEDGRLLMVTTSAGTTRVWRADGSALRTLPRTGRVTRGIFSPDGALVATIAADPSGDLTARVFDVRTGRLLHAFGEPGIQDVAFSPDGALLAAGDHDGSIHIWRPRTGRLVGTLADGGKDVSAVAFSPDGKLLASAGGDGATRVWTVADGSRLFFFPGHTGHVVAVAWSPDGRLVADASFDRTANLWGVQGLVEAGKLVASLPANRGGTSAIAFDPTGRFVATGGVRGGVRLWDATPEQRLVALGLEHGGSTAGSFSPDGRLALSVGADHTARIWDVAGHRLRHVLRSPGSVDDARFDPSGRLVATAGGDGRARIWSTATGALLRTLDAGSPLRLVRFSPDGGVVATGAADGSVALWRTRDGRKLHTLSAGRPVVDAAFDPDGGVVATASGNGAALWSARSGTLLHRLPVPGGVLGLAFSPDGMLLATADERATATLWDATTGRRVHVLRGHRQGTSVTDVVFSSNGRTLLTTGNDSDGRTWDVATGKQLKLLRGQFGGLTGGAFSPDGRWVVTAGPISAALWPTSTGQLLFYLRGHTGQLTSVSFSPDGRRVLSTSKDGSTRLYDCQICGDLRSLERLAESRLEAAGIRP